jgi:hypothetical protein
VIKIEPLKSAIGRALPEGRFRLAGARRRCAQLAIDPAPQVRLEQILELLLRLEFVKCRLERSILAAKPAVHKVEERVALRPPLKLARAIACRHGDIGGLAVDEHIRQAGLAKARDRVLELELGAGAVARPVGALE